MVIEIVGEEVRVDSSLGTSRFVVSDVVWLLAVVVIVVVEAFLPSLLLLLLLLRNMVVVAGVLDATGEAWGVKESCVVVVLTAS